MIAEGVLGIIKNNIKLISNNSTSNINIKKALKLWLKSHNEPNQSDIYIFLQAAGLASTDGKEYIFSYDGELITRRYCLLRSMMPFNMCNLNLLQYFLIMLFETN